MKVAMVNLFYVEQFVLNKFRTIVQFNLTWHESCYEAGNVPSEPANSPARRLGLALGLALGLPGRGLAGAWLGLG